jgi:hypothetical protein
LRQLLVVLFSISDCDSATRSFFIVSNGTSENGYALIELVLLATNVTTETVTRWTRINVNITSDIAVVCFICERRPNWRPLSQQAF